MRPYPQRDGESVSKECTRCHETLWIAVFRVLVTGHRASWCQYCELAQRAEAKRDLVERDLAGCPVLPHFQETNIFGDPC